jgi:hypothetical protein
MTPCGSAWPCPNHYIWFATWQLRVNPLRTKDCLYPLAENTKRIGEILRFHTNPITLVLIWKVFKQAFHSHSPLQNLFTRHITSWILLKVPCICKEFHHPGVKVRARCFRQLFPKTVVISAKNNPLFAAVYQASPLWKPLANATHDWEWSNWNVSVWKLRNLGKYQKFSSKQKHRFENH